MRLLIEANKVWAFVSRGLIMNYRNVFAVFEMFFWPLIGLFSVGLLTRFLQLGSETVSFVLIGAIAMNTVQIAQLDVSYALLYDVWGKSLKHSFIAPIRLWHVVLGSGLVGWTRGLAVYVIMILLSRWFFDMQVGWQLVLPLFHFFWELFLMALIEGVVVMALVLRFGHRAEITAWAISYLVLLLAGIYYPISLFPKPVQAMAHCLPLTYFLEDFRALYGFPTLTARPWLYGWGLGFLYLGAAYLLLRQSLNAALRHGTLLRLSE